MSKISWSPKSFAYDSYAPYIERFIAQEFPQLSSGKVEDVMSAVVAEFLSTKQYRVGPKPSPESEVMIRDVVRRAIEVGRPVPVLIALASVKVPIGECLDVAELSMLRVLHALHLRVTRHYALGVSVRLRLEDLTEYVISGEDGDDVPHIGQHVEHYKQSMTDLVNALGYDDFVTLVPESSLVKGDVFLQVANELAKDFSKYLDNGSKPDVMLESLGWKGGVSWVLSDYMYDRYDRLYPDSEHGDDFQRKTLARYLAAVLTRRMLLAQGGDPTFGGRLEIGFSSALPDAPVTSTRVYYRTVPLEHSSRHMPPWNAKGYIQVDEDGLSHFALGRWDEEYALGQLTIVGEKATARVRADYRIQESL